MAVAKPVEGHWKRGAIMSSVSSCFILSFKLGDNINHNLSVLALLYYYYNQEDQDGKCLLCKPIIILLVSIIEAVLHDFHRSRFAQMQRTC
jgi:hypothetical protein